MFKHPFTMILSGATGSGKTRWLSRFLDNARELIEDCPKRTLYAYGEINTTIIQMQETNRELKVHAGIPSEELIKTERDSNGALLLILDDLMLNAKSDFLDVLFTKGSHNWNVSVVFVTQHLFTKELRTARQNAHYLVLMRNPAGELQVRNLGAQLFPKRLAFFMECYKDATRKPFSYLHIDMHPNTPDEQRIKTNIYPGETTVVYVPKDASS